VHRRHGLDLSICWPLLEAVLDEQDRARIEESSDRVMDRVRNLLWSLFALIWIPLLPGTLAVAVIVSCVVLAIGLWSSIAGTVVEYCVLVEGLVLTNRLPMYRSIGWSPPASTDTEPPLGAALNRYLDRLAPTCARELVWPADD
jgi:hypothetical protein